jgi:hypothetical protein
MLELRPPFQATASLSRPDDPELFEYYAHQAFQSDLETEVEEILEQARLGEAKGWNAVEPYVFKYKGVLIGGMALGVLDRSSNENDGAVNRQIHTASLFRNPELGSSFPPRIAAPLLLGALCVSAYRELVGRCITHNENDSVALTLTPGNKKLRLYYASLGYKNLGDEDMQLTNSQALMREFAAAQSRLNDTEFHTSRLT